MTLGQKVKTRRRELGYTQTELADRMQMIISIAVALYMSIDYLLFDDRKAD